MSLDPEPMDEEDTNVMVMRAHRATRRVRLVVVGGIVVVIGLLVAWISSGPGGWEQRLRKHLGTPAESAAGAPAPRERPSCVTDPNAKTATIYVTLAQEGLLWLDDTPLGLLTSKNLDLAPGTHDIRAEIKRTVMNQTLTVKAGEEYDLRFDRERKAIELECAHPPSP
jgi:hypothetical protein